MRRATAILFLLASSVLALVVAGTGIAGFVPGASADRFRGQDLLVAYGDSFTQAWIPGVGDQPALSWATGTDPSVGSLLLRLRATEPTLQGFNAAVSGTRMEHLPLQVEASPHGARHVVIWLGINDACLRTDSSAFADAAQVGFDTVRRAHPQADVAVFAIPDLARLGALHANDPGAILMRTSAWCSPYFDPLAALAQLSDGQEDLAALNGILDERARAHGFRFSTATLWPDLAPADVCAEDFFHPGVQGEAKFAAAAWASIAPTRAPPPWLTLAGI